MSLKYQMTPRAGDVIHPALQREWSGSRRLGVGPRDEVGQASYKQCMVADLFYHGVQISSHSG